MYKFPLELQNDFQNSHLYDKAIKYSLSVFLSMFELNEALIFEFATANGLVVVHKLIECYLFRL